VTDAIANTAHFEPSPREERRLSPRSKMAEIVYVNMQAENGGILLDISASGFGFQVASPIAADPEIKFRFSAEGIEDLEITANIAWLDSDRKRGGVRFGQLPEKVRSRVNRWSGIPTSPGAVSPETVIRGAGESASHTQHLESHQIGRSSISELNPYSLTTGVSSPASKRNAVSDRALVELPNPLQTNRSFRPLLSPKLQAETEYHRRHVGAVVLSVFLLLFLGVGIFISNNKHQVGVSMIRLGERLSGEHSQQPTNSAHPTVARSSITSAPGPPEFATESAQAEPPSAGPNASALGSIRSGSTARDGARSDQPTKPSNTGQEALSTGPNDIQAKAPVPKDRTQKADTFNFASAPRREPASEKSQIRRPDEPVRDDDGHTELALARQYLRGSNVPKDRDMAAHLLWVAVGAGNPQAELELADLYLRNDGVPVKNCAQARILLNDASNSGNVEAGQQLEKLRDYGCR
jgi:hypothetical protein